LLDHSIYFYFACSEKDCLSVESVNSEERESDGDSNSSAKQLLLRVKDTMKEQNRVFKVSNLKGLE